MKQEIIGDTDYNWYAGNCTQKIGKKSRRVENRKTNRNHLNYCINKIG